METFFLSCFAGFMAGLFGMALAEHLRGPIRFRLISSGIVLSELVAYLIVSRFVPLPFLFALTGIAISIALLAVYRGLWQKNLRRLALSAPALKNFATIRFDDLDTDRDGTITSQDLYRAEARLASLPEYERRMINDLKSYIWLIGHVTGTIRSVSPMSGSIVEIHSYGISREDIARWPQKAHRQFDLDFGCICRR